MNDMTTADDGLDAPLDARVGGILPVLAGNPAFVSMMSSGWGPSKRATAVEPASLRSTAAHRELLSGQYPGQPVAVYAGAAMIRNDDNEFPFRADSDFLWLVGASIETAVLLMLPAAGGHDSVLFVPEPARPGGADFFSDRLHGELWVGPVPGVLEWNEALGIEVRPLAQLEGAIAAASRGQGLLVAGRPTGILSARPQRTRELGQTISELRLVKDDWEIGELRFAVDASVSGFAAVAAELGTAMESGGERWLQGTFDRHARTFGNGTGYGSIVGSGPHGAILHWTRCDGPVRPEHLLLLDAGVETTTFYTADITRTFPAGGTFSAEQRIVHDLVQRSHEAGLAAVTPGASFTDFHFASMEVIARGLDDWGLLPVSVDEALSDAGQQHRRFLVCGVGHHLGLDVHDCSKARHEAYQGARMKPGMVLTVEPGLYFHENDLTVPPELRGIGVRIEDDVLVTAEGRDVLSDALPIDADGLEKWVATCTDRDASVSSALPL